MTIRDERDEHSVRFEHDDDDSCRSDRKSVVLGNRVDFGGRRIFT